MTATTKINDENTTEWIDEQAEDVKKLVGSFVDSVHDPETDEVVEYQLIWEGGDLGIALTTLEEGASSTNPGIGVAVSRVTGKGFPFGIKNVAAGDILLSINTKDMTTISLQEAVAYLQECDLPATLRFRKSKQKTTDEKEGSVPQTSQDTSTEAQGVKAAEAGKQRFSSRASRGYKALGKQRTSMLSQFSGSNDAVFNDSEETSSEFTNHNFLMDSTIRTAKRIDPQTNEKQEEETYQKLEAARIAAADEFDAFFNQVDEQPAEEKNTEVVFDEYEDDFGDTEVGFDENLSLDNQLVESDEEFEDGEESVDSFRAQSIDQVPKKRLLQQQSSTAMLDSMPNKPDSIAMLKHPSISSSIGTFDKYSAGDREKMQFSNDLHLREDDDDDEDKDDLASNQSLNPSQDFGQEDRDTREDTFSSQLSDISHDDVAPSMDSDLVRQSQPLSALHTLCQKGNLRGVVQHLRVKGFSSLVEREPNHGQTGLHLAVKSGNAQLVKLIMEQYKPLEDIINLEDDKGNTALHFAATKSPGMVHMLLEHGAVTNIKNSRKLTPLIISIITTREDNVIIPRMLLKYGANPNDMHDSQTVIHTAIELKRLNIAGALVYAGAKLDVEDTEGRNVFEKLPHKSLRQLIGHIYFPPTFISEKERAICMLCRKKPGFGHRKLNCTHCGRFCCHECAALTMEMFKFPLGFPGRIRRGAANRDPKRVCKMCYNILKERNAEPETTGNRFIKRVIGIEWDEVNPEKLVKARAAGRRGGRQ
uniref:Myosinlike protein putative n=1 Tax=Albugo laibachii Nc14 TaxID=890382 RepID=F0VZT9_9STRA|nr:myosinlike protein putative [Albugo laibachii Nc14]|eukprot:CCA14310.1 myosinlike protein putative [Albugo laibachii Nc14]